MADVKQCMEGRIHGRHSWEADEPSSRWHVCRGVQVAVVERNPVVGDVTGMTFPYQCTRCNHIHDTGRLTDWHRYLDCTAWRCPNCQSLIDDRPVSWGGSAIPLDRDGREKR